MVTQNTLFLCTLFTQKSDIDESVPGGGRLEVDPAPVHAGLVAPDVVHHEGGGRGVEVEVGSLSELELVTPSRPVVPGQLPRIVTTNVNYYLYPQQDFTNASINLKETTLSTSILENHPDFSA